jgi:hypothetical protein
MKIPLMLSPKSYAVLGKLLLASISAYCWLGAARSEASVAISLEALFDGENLIVGDKLFSGWVLNGEVLVLDIDSDGRTVQPDFSQIIVEGLDDDLLNPGVKFNVNGQFTALGFDQLSLQFAYRVSTLDGSARIKGNSLSIENGYSFAGDGGRIAIFEDVNAENGDVLGGRAKHVFADYEVPPPQETDALSFSPQRTIIVTTSIAVAGFGSSDDITVASLDTFTQRFSQLAQTAQIPEPTSLAVWLALTAAVTLVAPVRRRMQPS